MAFGSMLRRASASVIPLAARAAGSRRAFHGAISAALCVEKRSVGNDVGFRSFLPFWRFSTSTAKNSTTDESLIRVLDSEIDCAEEPGEVGDLPDGFPFQIQDNPGERTIVLKREFQDEVITVEVDMPNIPFDEDAEDDDKKEDEEQDTSSIPLVVTIAKGKGQSLEFGITAFPDEITIDSLSIKNPENSEEQLAYEGPDFNDLDENLQKSFHKYLEIRGIRPSTTNFLFEYMSNKDRAEYLQWLKNIKTFIEK